MTAQKIDSGRLLPGMTIFLGSFLAFLVQPLVARTLLPVFGGTSAVWVTCLAAFQVLLVAGYWYAHGLGGGGRLKAHLGFLALAALWLAAMPEAAGRLAAWLGRALPHPAMATFAAVLLLVGLAYVLFAANATLVQTLAGGDYRLYAVSSLGSFAGLFAHPLVLEPFVPVRAQWLLLAAGTAVYAMLLRRCERMAGRYGVAEKETVPRATFDIRWFLLPAAGCFLLNAATAHMTANVAPLPLMWAVLLGAYLLSWTMGFSACGERLLPLWAGLGVSAAGGCALLREGGALSGGRVATEFALSLAMVLFGCAALHAWLFRTRPAGAQLSRYNLALAAGGAAGGILSGLVAPLAFDTILEWPVALVATAGALLLCLRRPLQDAVRRLAPAHAPQTGRCLFVLFAGIALAAGLGEWTARRGDLARGRSFYGAWRIYVETLRNRYGKEVAAYCFRHGGTLHGMEPVNRLYRKEGTTYYGPDGGGLAFSLHPGYAAGRPVRAGLVGMGVGTMAKYGRAGDLLRFYEICPQVARVALEGPWFDYVRCSKAQLETVLGDARKSLEDERAREEPRWDVLVVDAYSGDAIPVQLVTKEAFRLYRDRLATGGVLALHLSNWHVDLVPAAKAAAAMLGMECVVVSAPPRGFESRSTWAFLSEKGLSLPEGIEAVPLEEVPERRLPSDGCGGLLPFVRIML